MLSAPTIRSDKFMQFIVTADDKVGRAPQRADINSLAALTQRLAALLYKLCERRFGEIKPQRFEIPARRYVSRAQVWKQLHVAVLPVALLIGGGAAHHTYAYRGIINETDDHEYRKPGPTDLRGPCPGINTVANHGYIPRDGRNFSTADLAHAFWDAYGITPDIAIVGMIGGFFPHVAVPDFRINMTDLAKHIEFGEHDLSWSRDEYLLGDPIKFNQTLWNVALEQLTDPVTEYSLARARVARAESRAFKIKHKIDFDIGQTIFANIEGGFITSVFADEKGETPLAWVRSFFEHERLPSHLGWERHTGTNSFGVFAKAVKGIMASPELWFQTGKSTALRFLTPSGLKEFFDQRFKRADILKLMEEFRAEMEQRGDHDLGPLTRLTEMLKRM
ncbi:heme-thiolate peroxidase [Lecanicillium saksenae]|uniref:Heme-thiolate peroxidase n=1 Tax=Lecanicillium saksenae TaxID=468837 RepID=A0ACC1R5K7_9HYPO|nr:heme-thiolate peroxidase [Lecanicillium saksenae]